ncbi:zinc-binding metallopeptidase family protein [Ramlibacter sp. MMS24-I3-19]|uniref:zinc-binding metallopeptidase family protein n=1 Tax=Ramlibacter sp. MMS24-I3-19 TaxID=3416606 RepID=UPI003CFDC4C3
MKTFRCDHCGHPLFFENVTCLQCGSSLAFLPDRLALCAVEPAEGEGLWRRKTARGRMAGAPTYRLCHNTTAYQACNFAVPADDPNPLCVSCRQTRVLPDLSVPENVDRWFNIEAAKRRLFFTLARLGLVAVTPPNGERDGPVFEFKADVPGEMVMTGHAEGVITLNVAEADDAERVKRRVELHEPYRTLLGHLRHESGHYYWDRLIDEGGRVEEFRKVFGDESIDYAEALQRHYASGGQPPGWENSFVSAYATSHPWEDWAETWAHYLHMVDLLETAAAYNTRVEVPGAGGDEVDDPFEMPDFDKLVEQWVPVTLLVNSLNRSLGQGDAYPFALSQPALDKLRFVHNVIRAPRKQAAPAPAAGDAGSAMAKPEPAPQQG